MANKTIQTPRGTRDVLPEDQIYYRHIEKIARGVLDGLGYNQISLPHFESVELFNRSIGDATDIVQKELFLLESRKDSADAAQYALRPEGTAGCVRSYIQNGMGSWPQPVKLYYSGAMFRYERPQKGRYREFNQIGAEIFGDATARTDYLTIMTSWEILSRLGIKNMLVYANSIGCEKCRPKYITKLKKYYKDNFSKLCGSCQSRYEKNPLRLLDCKEAHCQEISKNAPSTLDNLCTDCKKHFSQTLEYLDYFNIKYDLDPSLVRGLDYYNKTVFEIVETTDLGRNNTLCGGGRYDGLVEQLGGVATPAVGFSIGVERLVSIMKEQGIVPDKIRQVEVCILQLGEKAKEVSKKVYDELSKNDINVFFIPSDEGLRPQIKYADKLGARYAAIIGQQEAVKNEVILKDLKNSSQEIFPVENIAAAIKKYIS
ncbi:MAG: histidine--tRNA ligase [Candidatus Berkelbacteria bacterium]